MADVKPLIARFERMKDDRSTWEETWQQVADHMFGRRDFETDRLLGGTQRVDSIYDTTGMQAADFLRAAMHSLLTNPATKWFKLLPKNKALLQSRDAVLWYEGAEEQLRFEFSRPEARFQTQISEVYFDEVGFGTGGLFIEEDPVGGVRFSARPLSELFLAENALGVVDTVYCQRKMTARQIISRFGQGASPKADRLLAQNRPEETLLVVQMIRPREDPLPERIDAAGMAWESVYISLEEKAILRESGYHEKPLLTPRWTVDSGEVYGRGPGIVALPDQKMLNEMSRTMIASAQKAVAPPVMVDDVGVLSQVDINPQGITVVRYDGSNRDPIREIRSTANFVVGDGLIEQRQNAVRQAFHSELLAIFKDPRMTATQVLELATQAQRMLSPTLGQQQSELLEPTVERVFGVSLRQNRLPPIPDVLRGTEVQVEYQSPVARAQKQSEHQALLQAFAALQGVAQSEPDVMDILDTDKFGRELWETQSLPESLLRSDAEIQERRRVRAEVVQQQTALDQAEQAAGAIGSAGPALTAIQGGLGDQVAA